MTLSGAARLTVYELSQHEGVWLETIVGDVLTASEAIALVKELCPPGSLDSSGVGARQYDKGIVVRQIPGT